MYTVLFSIQYRKGINIQGFFFNIPNITITEKNLNRLSIGLLHFKDEIVGYRMVESDQLYFKNWRLYAQGLKRLYFIMIYLLNLILEFKKNYPLN